MRKLGEDPELVVKFPPEYEFGDSAYVAQLDIFHQLHCLNLLRHIAWGEFERDGTTAKWPYSDLYWIHIAYCTEVMRENLVCSANLDVITFNWEEMQNLPFTDFNLNKSAPMPKSWQSSRGRTRLMRRGQGISRHRLGLGRCLSAMSTLGYTASRGRVLTLERPMNIRIKTRRRLSGGP